MTEKEYIKTMEKLFREWAEVKLSDHSFAQKMWDLILAHKEVAYG